MTPPCWAVVQAAHIYPCIVYRILLTLYDPYTWSIYLSYTGYRLQYDPYIWGIYLCIQDTANYWTIRTHAVQYIYSIVYRIPLECMIRVYTVHYAAPHSVQYGICILYPSGATYRIYRNVYIYTLSIHCVYRHAVVSCIIIYILKIFLQK